MPSSPHQTIEVVVFSRQSSDLTLISSDNVYFQVHSIMMREASTPFAQLFDANTKHPPTVVLLEEDAQTLDLLLSWIYPSNERPIISSIRRLAPLFAVARKYDVAYNHLRSCLTLSAIVRPDPVAVYLLCLEHHLVKEGRVAVREIIVQNIDVMKRVSSSEFKGIYAGLCFWNLKRIDELREQTRRAALALINREFAPRVKVRFAVRCTRKGRCTHGIPQFIERFSERTDPFADGTYATNYLAGVPWTKCAHARLSRVRREVFELLKVAKSRSVLFWCFSSS